MAGPRKVTTMTQHNDREQNIAIFVDELSRDEELRQAFFRNPRRTLQRADEWGLPFSASEIQSLMAAGHAVWERVAEELSPQLIDAA
jgi:hypothetical protein